MTNLNFLILAIMDYKGLGFILFIAAILLIFGFDKVVELVIRLIDKIKNTKDK